MIQNIPTHLIAGPLGAGKTTLLKHLMHQRPESEQWGILINEFGQIGIDAALLGNDSLGISLAEIPGGCLCCVNGLPFQVGLNRLLRKARPTRLFIEASGLGHPLALMQQLAAPPWQGVLALQPLIMVLDANQLAAGKPLAESQRLAVAQTGLLLLNKSGGLDQAARQRVERELEDRPRHWCDNAEIDLGNLPTSSSTAHDTPSTATGWPDAQAQPMLWLKDGLSSQNWHCMTQRLNQHFSIGWRIHPEDVFNIARLQAWLMAAQWIRAKGIVRTTQGWMAFNALPGEAIVWQRSAWQKDNRIELLSAHRPDQSAMESSLRMTVDDHP